LNGEHLEKGSNRVEKVVGFLTSLSVWRATVSDHRIAISQMVPDQGIKTNVYLRCIDDFSDGDPILTLPEESNKTISFLEFVPDSDLVSVKVGE
jgi:hypothetical protein